MQSIPLPPHRRCPFALAVVTAAILAACSPGTQGSDADGGTDADATSPGDTARADGSDAGDTERPDPEGWEPYARGFPEIQRFQRVFATVYADPSGTDAEVFRRTDAGWKPVGNSQPGKVLVEDGRLRRAETARTSAGEFLALDGELYANTDTRGWESSPRDIPGRDVSYLGAVGDRLVVNYVELDGSVPVKHVAFSSDGGENWNTQKEFRSSVTVRAWDESVFVQRGDELHVWKRMRQAWRTHDVPAAPRLSQWRRTDDGFASVSPGGVFRTSAEGLNWTDHGGEGAPSSRIVETFSPGEVGRGGRDVALVAVTRDGTVAAVDDAGNWRRWTEGIWGASTLSPVPTGAGLLSTASKLPLEWEASREDWRPVRIDDLAAPPRVELAPGGDLWMIDGGQLFEAEGGGFTWRPRESADLAVGGEGGLFRWAECLERYDGEAAAFRRVDVTPNASDTGTVCPEQLDVWPDRSRSRALVETGAALFVGLEGSRVGGGHGIPMRRKGGGFLRLDRSSGDVTDVGESRMTVVDEPRPWVRELEAVGADVVVEVGIGGDRIGLFRSGDGGDFWSRMTRSVEATSGSSSRLDAPVDLMPVDGRLFAHLTHGEDATPHRRDFAVLEGGTWRVLAKQPPGDLRVAGATDSWLYAATTEGVYARRSHGAEWTSIAGGLRDGTIVGLGYRPSGAVAVFADGAIWRRQGLPPQLR